MTKRESNILKCLAIMLMLCHHLFMYANWPEFYTLAYGPLFSTSDLLAHFGKMGNACVSIFIFVTAYGTAVSYRRRDMQGDVVCIFQHFFLGHILVRHAGICRMDMRSWKRVQSAL